MLYRDLVTGDRVVYEREGVYVKGTVASPYTITPPFKPIYIAWDDDAHAMYGMSSLEIITGLYPLCTACDEPFTRHAGARHCCPFASTVWTL